LHWDYEFLPKVIPALSDVRALGPVFGLGVGLRPANS